MKLVFQKNSNGIELGFVECLSTKEADEFLSWFAGRSGPMPTPAESTQQIENTEVVEDAPAQPAEPVQKEVNKSDVSQAAIALVQSKGRDALTPILAKYNAKRIAEIRQDDLGLAFADIREAQGAV